MIKRQIEKVKLNKKSGKSEGNKYFGVLSNHLNTDFVIDNNVQRTKCFRCSEIISFPAKVTPYTEDL